MNTFDKNYLEDTLFSAYLTPWDAPIDAFSCNLKKSGLACLTDKNWALSVLLSCPSKDGFARLDGRLGKIARLTPVFL